MPYPELHKTKRLEKIRDIFLKKLEGCDICPRKCRVNRLKDELGFCQTGHKAVVNSGYLHFGEEPEISGQNGSGTIFFSHCNLACVYCQNYSISQLGEGTRTTPSQLAEMMLSLQKQGACNINFVTPTHVVAQILEALVIAVEGGLRIPLVYNCGGYESVDSLSLLEGIIDIYMPDVKYSDAAASLKYSGAGDYWQIAQKALLEMQRQAGDLAVENGVAKKGLLVRHLVLPGDLAGSFKIINFIKKEVSRNCFINIMDQYYPCYKAGQHSGLSRRLTREEYLKVVTYAETYR